MRGRLDGRLARLEDEYGEIDAERESAACAAFYRAMSTDDLKALDTQLCVRAGAAGMTAEQFVAMDLEAAGVVRDVIGRMTAVPVPESWQQLAARCRRRL